VLACAVGAKTNGFVNPGNGNIPPGTPAAAQRPQRALFPPAYTASTTLDWKHDFGGLTWLGAPHGGYVSSAGPIWDPQNSAFSGGLPSVECFRVARAREMEADGRRGPT